MLRPVQLRDAVTAIAVRPRDKSLEEPSAPPDSADARAPMDAPAQSGAIEMDARLRAGAIVAGRYRLEERLGGGGMGEVWRARHITLRTLVAVKFPSIAVRGRAATTALTRFRFEAQISARLGQESRHVVAVHDAGCDAAGPYLVMEHVRGPTLQRELDEHSTLRPQRVAAIVAQVAEALAVAHGHGVVHRDLKPSNLLLGADGDGALLVKVADFGIAKALTADLGADLPEDTTGGVMLGSPPYMSPEQISGAAASAQGDLWALAVIAYEAITGRLPFHGRSFAELIASLAAARFTAPSAVRPEIPTAVDAWFARALAKDEARRFVEAREMAAALGEAAAEPRTSARSRWAARLQHVAGLFTARPARPSEDPCVEGRASFRDLG